MKVFISYHRADTKYRDKVVTLLKKMVLNIMWFLRM